MTNSTTPDAKARLQAPQPKRGQVELNRVSSHTQLSALPPQLNRQESKSAVPQSHHVIPRRPSYSTIESSRESHYNLDYPDDREQLLRDQLKPSSRFYARDYPRTLDLPSMLPYQTESPQDQAKFLAHIVSHLYLAIKTGDIQGSLPVSARDLAELKDAVGVSDIDLALETNLFVSGDGTCVEVDSEIKDTIVFEGDDDSDFDNDDDDDRVDDVEDANTGSSTTSQHKKSPKSAAVVGVRTWTQELLVWLKMKYDMPVSLRIALTRVYYALCLCRGQNVNFKIYVKAFETLTKHTPFLVDQGLQLDWQPLYREFINHMTPIDAISGVVEVKDQRQMLRLATRAAPFFPESALPEIYSSVSSHMTYSNAPLVTSALSLMPNKFSDGGEHDARYYLEPLFYVWHKMQKSSNFEDHMSGKLGAIASEALSSGVVELGEYGIFTEIQFSSVMRACMTCLSINPSKYSSSRSMYYHGYALIIVFSLTPTNSDAIFSHLKALFNSIESYVYPQNSGEWTSPISKLVYALCYQFQKRYNLETNLHPYHRSREEYNLDRATIDNFVDILLPIVRTGIQSKSQGAVDKHLLSVSMLAQMAPEKVLEKVTVDLYESLRGSVSTHRVSVALRLIGRLARFFAATPVYRVHLVHLMSMVLPGIDSNDLDKTLNTLDIFATSANFIPYADLTDGQMDSMLAVEYTSNHLEYLESLVYGHGSEEMAATFVDNDLEVNALMSASSSFPILIRSFCERLFNLLENIPDPNISVGSERDFTDWLPKFLFVIIEALSPELFELMRKEIFDWAFSNTFHSIAEVVGEVCGALIKRDPSYFPTVYDLVKTKIIEEIEENGAGQSRTGTDIVPRDQALFWDLIIFNECISNSGSHLLKVGDDAIKFSLYLMDKVKGPAIFTSSYIVNSMLLATTKIRLEENRVYDPSKPITVDTWSPDLRPNRDYHFKWFIPGDDDVSFAVNCFSQHVQKTLANVQSLITNNESASASKTDVSDEFRSNLLYLCFSLSGVSHLLDPSFEEDIPKLDHRNESLEDRLLLLKRIRTAADKNSGQHIETSDIQRIVDDIKDSIIEVGKFSEDDLEALVAKVSDDEATSRENHSNGSGSPVPPSAVPERLQALKTSGDDISRSSTPQVDGVVVSQMNPAITFRERKLYTSAYFFGDEIEQRRSSERYLQLHRTRQLIGKSLHMICKYFVANFPENIKLFKHLLYVMNIYFSDVGKERVLDPSHAQISYGFVKTSQEINRMRKPYTRLAVGARLEQYHHLRVALHATSRNQTPLDKLLIEDIVKLSVSPYADIAGAAQNLVGDVLKRINGSYGTLVKSSLRAIIKALDQKQYLRVQSGLGLFEVKRVQQKIENDYMHLERYSEMLQRCIAEVDGLVEVQATAKGLYQILAENIPRLSKVCLINWDEIDAIRPPDDVIDLEIAAVKAAKDRKYSLYHEKLANLQNNVLKWSYQTSVWWNQALQIGMLLNLQTNLNVPIHTDTLKRLVVLAGSDHPDISRWASKGFNAVIQRMFQLQSREYNMDNVYDLTYVPRGVEVIDAQQPGFAGEWNRWLSGEEPTPFYLDIKPDNGWLFWGNELKVMSRDPQSLAALSAEDKASLEALRPLITKEWFTGIIKLWLTEAESQLVFQLSDVSFVLVLVMLLSNGYGSFTCTELLEVMKSVYVKDEKATHMLCCEVIAGVLAAARVSDPTFADERDTILSEFLEGVFNDVTPDTKDIWEIFAWWLPKEDDMRRFPKLWKLLSNVNLSDVSDSLIRVMSPRLGYLRSSLVSLSWLIPNPDKYLDFCSKNISYRYETIRDQIGELLASLAFAFFSEQVPNARRFIEATKTKDNSLVLYRSQDSNKFLQLVPKLFARVEDERLKVVDLPVKEKLHSDYVYCAATILTWLYHQLKNNTGVMLRGVVVEHIVPFLLRLIELKEVPQLGDVKPEEVFKLASQVQYDSVGLEDLVSMLQKYEGTLTVAQTLIIGEFTEAIFFNNLMILTKDQRQRLINLEVNLLFHRNAEIREAAGQTVSGLVHSTPPDEVESTVVELKKRFFSIIDQLRRKHSKTNFKKMSPGDVTQLHGAVLGLGALVDAFSFTSPPPVWMPEILAKLASRASGISGTTGKTAKEILGRFKKNRQDSWHVDSKSFSEEQMHDLEGVLWKSYFI